MIWREYLQIQLSDTLDAGAKYILTYYVSLGDEMWYATKRIGAYFSAIPLNIPNPNPLPVTPQIENTTLPLTNKTAWTALTDTFTAAGGEQYLIIGNFNSDGNSDTIFVGGPNYNPAAHYFVDDVSLTLLSGAGVGENNNASNSLTLSPNPTSGIFNLQSEAEIKEVEIYNCIGEVVASWKVGKLKVDVDLSSQPKGIYFVRAVTDKGTVTGKVVVE